MLKDTQSKYDGRKISIDKVGIKDILLPIIVKDKSKGEQSTVAKISMFVRLSHKFKGTHMSRFVEVMNSHKDNISILSVKLILDDMKERLESDLSHIELNFPYFVNKTAPVSKLESIMNYDCSFIGTADKDGKDFILTVKVPLLSLCPCSKEISEYGAHNQRSVATISVRYNKLIWIEDIVEIAESSASAPIYSLLKREDEKYITELAYNNPMFVEDIVRSITEKLLADDRVSWFTVECENMESIHNHNAYATITRDKRTN